MKLKNHGQATDCIYRLAQPDAPVRCEPAPPNTSILDSFSDETHAEFERSIRAEQTSASTTSTSSEKKASATTSASGGWGEAKASGSYAKASSESRTRFANNVASATAKNTARA